MLKNLNKSCLTPNPVMTGETKDTNNIQRKCNKNCPFIILNHTRYLSHLCLIIKTKKAIKIKLIINNNNLFN